jgi:hypothetical protein
VEAVGTTRIEFFLFKIEQFWIRDRGIVIVPMAKTELQITRQKATPNEFTPQMRLARIVCEVSRTLEDRAIQAIMDACLHKQT